MKTCKFTCRVKRQKYVCETIYEDTIFFKNGDRLIYKRAVLSNNEMNKCKDNYPGHLNHTVSILNLVTAINCSWIKNQEHRLNNGEEENEHS